MAQGDPPKHDIEETKNQQIDYLASKVKFNQNIYFYSILTHPAKIVYLMSFDPVRIPIRIISPGIYLVRIS